MIDFEFRGICCVNSLYTGVVDECFESLLGLLSEDSSTNEDSSQIQLTGLQVNLDFCVRSFDFCVGIPSRYPSCVAYLRIKMEWNPLKIETNSLL